MPRKSPDLTVVGETTFRAEGNLPTATQSRNQPEILRRGLSEPAGAQPRASDTTREASSLRWHPGSSPHPLRADGSVDLPPKPSRTASHPTASTAGLLEAGAGSHPQHSGTPGRRPIRPVPARGYRRHARRGPRHSSPPRSTRQPPANNAWSRAATGPPPPTRAIASTKPRPTTRDPLPRWQAHASPRPSPPHVGDYASGVGHEAGPEESSQWPVARFQIERRAQAGGQRSRRRRSPSAATVDH
jgi:hypothetical protein